MENLMIEKRISIAEFDAKYQTLLNVRDSMEKQLETCKD
jgi:hypothetical protein